MMENITIRRAKLDDLYEIQRLNNELFNIELKNYDDSLKEYWPISKEGEAYFRGKILNDVVIVACLEDDPIGYLAGSLKTQYSYNKTIQAEIDNMCLKEEFRHLGIGKRLVKAFKNICLDNDINEIKVTASFNNKSAINFYKEFGFEEAEITLKQKI